MTASETVFANLPELLRCLAEQIRNRRQLATLCLVNKTFNAAITPFLYRELDIGGTEAQSQSAFTSNRHHDYVRSLVFGTSGDLLNNQLNGTVLKMLQMLPGMPLLESLIWRSQSSLPLKSVTLDVLRDSCPSIKRLEIRYPENTSTMLGYSQFVQPDNWGAIERVLYQNPNITGFPNLEELTLQNLFEDLPWWKSQIVQVLKSSPRLRKLDLSISVVTLVNYKQEEQREMFDNFFDDLCDEYGETGSGPRRLRSLRLGTAMYPLRADSLKKLTDLRFLEEVYVENRGVWCDGIIIDMYNDDEEDSGIPFDAFGPTHCPNLRRLDVATYHRDVHAFLASISDVSFTRRLAISAVHMGLGYELAALLRPDQRYPSLPLCPRMLNIDLQRDQMRLLDEDAEDIDEDDIPSAKQVLEDLVSADNGTLEGLGVHLTENINDGPEDGFEESELDLLVRTVGKLVGLTQLAVLPAIYSAKLTKEETFERAARRLAAAAPCLRYISVYGFSWRIWRRKDDTIALDVLDNHEIDGVELFRAMNWEP